MSFCELTLQHLLEVTSRRCYFTKRLVALLVPLNTVSVPLPLARYLSLSISLARSLSIGEDISCMRLS